MGRVLVSWIGGNDLAAVSGKLEGPIATTLSSESFDEAHLLYNYPKKEVDDYLEWLQQRVPTEIKVQSAKLRSPVDHGEIYGYADTALSSLKAANSDITVLLSPGTPAMHAVWILLGKTKYRVDFVQSSSEEGVQRVDIPFDISAEFLPGVAEQRAGYFVRDVAVPVSIDAAFDDILTQNPDMNSLKSRATVLATWEVPVLIHGETGTGKELFATAIHNASRRQDKPFKTVNCGAMPVELVDSILFGHVKGAFTGAVSDQEGIFKQADGGTLFLDEFGDLSAETQVRLLRVLQTGEINPIGSKKSEQVDIRVVAATNRNLIDDVASGKFREDLFYRIAVGVIHLPPIRERKGDVGLLVAEFLKQINEDASDHAKLEHKHISPKAKNILLNHTWPGNVRELYSTLLRACLWSTGKEILPQDVDTALFQMTLAKGDILKRVFDKNFEIQSLMDEVAKHYIKKALGEVGGSKTRAAALLGLPNYQTLNNWMKKYDLR